MPITISDGGVVCLTQPQSVDLGQIRAQSLNVNVTAGNITQNSTTNIVVSGLASLTATGTIQLNNATNSFGNLVLSSPQTTITVSGAMTIGSMQVLDAMS